MVAAATVNVAALELPPPGAGLTTVTATLPAEARSAAPMLALSWLLLTNVVVRLLPPHCTVELDKKLEPFTVSVNANAPAGALVGEIELTLGTGLGVGVGAGVGVGPGVAPDPEPQPAAPTTMAIASRATVNRGIVSHFWCMENLLSSCRSRRRRLLRAIMAVWAGRR